jgi:hypothetical protein
MTLPALAEEIGTLIDYARPRFTDERWPVSSVLRPAREILTSCIEAYHLHRTRFGRIAERKQRNRQLTEDGNVEITGRNMRALRDAALTADLSARGKFEWPQARS